MENGRLSFDKDDTGNRVVDPAELERVFGASASARRGGRRRRGVASTRRATHRATRQLEIERSKRTMLEQRVDELREERDRWRNQAERILTDQRPQEREREAVATQCVP